MTITDPPAPNGSEPMATSDAPAIGTPEGDRLLQERLRDAARVIAGFEDEDEVNDGRSLRQVLRDENASAYPLIAMAALSMSQNMGTSGAQILDPIIAETFGIGVTLFIVMDLMAQIVGFAIPLLTSLIVKDRPLRAVITVVAGLVWALTVIWAGFVPSALWWIAYRLIDTSTSSIGATVEGSLAMDLYPPKVRVRAFAFLYGGQSLAGIVVPATVLFLIWGFDMTWRGVFVVLGVLATLFSLVAVGLRDPGYGVQDRDHLKELIREELGDAGENIEFEAPKVTHPGFFEVYRTLWDIIPMRLSIMGLVVAGISSPILIAVSFYLINEVDFQATDLAIMAIIGSLMSLIGLAFFAPIGDRWFRKSPRTVYWFASVLSVIGTMSLTLNVFNATKAGAFVLTALTALAFSFIGPASAVGGMTVVPPEYRHYTGSVFAVAVLSGNIVGTGLFAGANESVGFGPALIALGLITVVGAVLNGFAGNHLLDAVDDSNERYIDEEINRLRLANGYEPPMLECVGVDASYGPVQALYEVDFALQEGEMMALLGLNGSGKSTLLKVLAGEKYPDAGSVRYRGNLVSFAEMERRVRLGIVMMPGGKAAFPSLTVRQNLELAATAPTARGRAEQVVSSLDRFPALDRLLDRPAALLSGGERQMLGLARAFLLKPKVLLIDELSLGLAPLIVEQLMEHVRDLNAEGTTIVLVEQSINVAVDLVDRAVFLDRGVVRFDGPIEDLKNRDDLLRAVFLREEL